MALVRAVYDDLVRNLSIALTLFSPSSVLTGNTNQLTLCKLQTLRYRHTTKSGDLPVYLTLTI